MKFNFFKKAQAATATETVGAVTIAPTEGAIPTSAADIPGSNNTEISRNDMFEEIKSKFLNEIDKIPRE